MTSESPGALYLGLDVGTQGTKALLYDNDTHTVVAIGSSSYGLIPSDVPARAEQHPDTWLEVDTPRLAESFSRKPYDVSLYYLKAMLCTAACMRTGYPPGYCAGLSPGAGRWPPSQGAGSVRPATRHGVP